VAEAAVTAYRRRSFLGRHPTAALLVFGISPIALLVLLAGFCAGGLWLFDEAGKWIGLDTEQSVRNLKRFDPAASLVVPYVGSLLIVVIPSVLASIFYCKLASRLGLRRRWILVSGVVLAATALMPICSAQLSEIPGESRLAVGVWNPLHIEHLLGTLVWCFCSPRQLFQFLIPLAIASWFMRRHRVAGQLQTAS
jgi:hypothetical protein